MKNTIILLGLAIYATSIFLPWGPIGSTLESGFNDEASPGLIPILSVIICLVFGLRTTKKSGAIVLVLGVLMLLFPITVITKILEATQNSIGEIRMGVYSLIVGSLVIIYGAILSRKKAGIIETDN